MLRVSNTFSNARTESSTICNHWMWRKGRGDHSRWRWRWRGNGGRRDNRTANWDIRGARMIIRREAHSGFRGVSEIETLEIQIKREHGGIPKQTFGVWSSLQ